MNKATIKWKLQGERRWNSTIALSLSEIAESIAELLGAATHIQVEEYAPPVDVNQLAFPEELLGMTA